MLALRVSQNSDGKSHETGLRPSTNRNASTNNEQTEDSDIERTKEYTTFIKKLADYHANRGTAFQKEPVLGPRRLSLLKLYEKVVALGGYDVLSEEKSAWKNLATEYNIPAMSNPGMPGYLLKTIYYKNLA